MAESKAPVSPYFFSQGRPREFVFQTVNSLDTAPGERYGDWLQAMLYNFELAPPSREQARDFRASITSLATATSELHDMRSDDFEGYRARHHIRKNEDSKLALIYVMHGRVISEHEGDLDQDTRQGQFFLFDAQRPSRIRFSGSRFVQLNLPRLHVESMFAAGMPAPSQISKAMAVSRLSSLLAMQLQQFSSLASQLDQIERLGLLDATEALALTILENACFRTNQPSEDRHAGLYLAAQRYIRQHLAAENLNSRSLATALGCSRATLYRVFAQHKLSIAEHIRELRLQKLARLLADANKRMYSIAALAQRCGLHDSPNLSRMFRQRFGMTPQEFRLTH